MNLLEHMDQVSTFGKMARESHEEWKEVFLTLVKAYVDEDLHQQIVWCCTKADRKMAKRALDDVLKDDQLCKLVELLHDL